MLLYQMLPRKVAETLKVGQKVGAGDYWGQFARYTVGVYIYSAALVALSKRSFFFNASIKSEVKIGFPSNILESNSSSCCCGNKHTPHTTVNSGMPSAKQQQQQKCLVLLYPPPPPKKKAKHWGWVGNLP